MLTLKLELIPMPVSDIDRAKAFYVDQIGFHMDHDVTPSEGVRVCQLTPPGSGCSILLSRGFPDVNMQVGSLRGLHLVASSIAEAHQTLIGRGVTVTDITDMGGIKFASFSDPDGNAWVLQELPARN
jgi:catechol 2,3-dioxygenase-like lactoylglutathione lyase family enzyme